MEAYIATFIFQCLTVIGQLIAPGRIFFSKPATIRCSRGKSSRTGLCRFHETQNSLLSSDGRTEEVWR